MDNILHIHFRIPLAVRRLIATSSTRNRMNETNGKYSRIWQKNAILIKLKENVEKYTYI